MRNRSNNAIIEPIALFRIKINDVSKLKGLKAITIATAIGGVVKSLQVRSVKFVAQSTTQESDQGGGYTNFGGSITWANGKTIWARNQLIQAQSRPDKMSPESFWQAADSDTIIIADYDQLASAEILVAVRYNITI